MLLLATFAWAHNPHSMIVGACLPAADGAPWYVLYDGAESNVLYRSVDAGRTWAPVHAAATRDALTALTCTSSMLVAIGAEGVWTSADAATWTLDPSIPAPERLAADDDQVLVLNADGLWWGTPGAWSGPTAGPWTVLGGGPGGLVAADAVGGLWRPSDPQAGAPGEAKSVVTDGVEVWVGGAAGSVWSTAGVASVLPDDGNVVALAVGRDGRLLAATANRGPFESTDGGATWSDPGSPFVTLYGESGAAESEDEAVTALAGTADTTLIAGWYGVAVDGSDGWRHEAILSPDSLRDVAFSPDFNRDGLILAAGLGGGVLRTLDGGATWDAPGWGMPAPNIQRVAIDPDDTASVYAIVDHELYHSTDAGASWAYEPGPYAKLSEVVVADGVWIVGDVAAGGLTGNLARAAGDGWEDILPGVDVGKVFVDGGELCASGANRVVCWADGWTERYGHSVTAMAGSVWADGDGVWLDGTRVLAGDADPIDNLAAADDGTLFATTRGGGVFRSDDGGETWADLGLDLPAAPVTLEARPGFAEHPELLLATYDGLWLVDDAGARPWGQFQSIWATAGFLDCRHCATRADDCAPGRKRLVLDGSDPVRIDWRGTALYADETLIAEAEDGDHETVWAGSGEIGAFTTAGVFSALAYDGGGEHAPATCAAPSAEPPCGCVAVGSGGGWVVVAVLAGLARVRRA